jgi:hypothetical protein
MRDLKAFAAQRHPYQWFAAFMAMAMPVAILVLFYTDGRTNIQPGAQVIYVESWSATRTVEETKAANLQRQREREAQQKERQRQYRALGRRLGMNE